MAEPTDDLDELLDSALDDFGKIDLGSSQKKTSNNGDRDTEKTSSSSLVSASQVQGLGLGLPDLKSKKKGKQKTVEDSHVTEALDKLTQQTREAVKRFESAVPPMSQADLLKDGMEDFVKQFQDHAGSQDMDSIVETMMQQLLSKEILHEPMKEIGERYPKWLEEHKTELKQEEYERYCRQYELIKKLNEVYENDPSNFPQIFDLMQRMQECGQPPNDIVQELTPDSDLTSFGNPLFQEMTDPNADCCIM
ncbi:peroxisome biogenesis protein 19-1-like [Aristolochia californica]|uniref:peroxisome biogenesis protein 19-1-like n=1 Tax=Aristolochia californica TaxID=171875 RepID=UPI0035E04BEC